jgi:diaminopimelate epimerase
MGEAKILTGPGGEKLNVTAESGESREFVFHEIQIGNPHAIIFVDDINSIDLKLWGPPIENNFRFPNRTNVEFVQVVSRSKVLLKVWERGAGATLACGSGACATAVACVHTGKTEPQLEVLLPGGTLNLNWRVDHDPQDVLMTGPAEFVFDGVWNSNS